MTWGSNNNPKQPPPAYTATGAAVVPVSSQYEHHPKKSVLTVSSIVLISGFFCLLLGIARETLAERWHGLGLFCGIFFIITGILGIVSVYKRTKSRLIATAILALLACLAAVWLGTYISNWYWTTEGSDGVMGDRMDGRTDRHRELERRTRRDHGSGEKGDGDRVGDRKGDNWDGEDMYDYILGTNAFMFVFSLLVFCCSVSLTVFTLKTVTSPRYGPSEGIYPNLTPVVAFPYSKDPNQLDSFNGNDDYI
jgi:Flp pilus assembly protein TadB